MDFINWSGQAVNMMADQFAKCDDADEIREVLFLFHQMWTAELDTRLRVQQKTAEFLKTLNALDKPLMTA